MYARHACIKKKYLINPPQEFCSFWHNEVFSFRHLHEYNLHISYIFVCLFVAEESLVITLCNDIQLDSMHNYSNLHKCDWLQIDSTHPKNVLGNEWLNMYLLCMFQVKFRGNFFEYLWRSDLITIISCYIGWSTYGIW